jgi:hypothetical protein
LAWIRRLRPLKFLLLAGTILRSITDATYPASDVVSMRRMRAMAILRGLRRAVRQEDCMSFPRFLFRVKDRQIEEEAQNLVAHFGIKDVEIRRDDTIKDAWFEDNVALKTTYGLDDIREYMERLTAK